MDAVKKKGEILVCMSNSEALVLFDWLARFNENSVPSTFTDQAEERVLYDLEASLEASITEVLDPKYRELVNIARSLLRDDK